MSKIVHVQTVMMQRDIDTLKTKTNQDTTKDALNIAAEHYLVCTEERLRAALVLLKEYTDNHGGIHDQHVREEVLNALMFELKQKEQ